MEFAVDHRVHGDLAIVTVAGEIDVFTCARLRDELQDLIQDGTQHLVVDLNDVEFLDSAGLGVLVGAYHRLRGGEGTLVFVGANDRVRKIFHITQLMKIFPLHPTLDAALEASGGFPNSLLFGFSCESAGERGSIQTEQGLLEIEVAQEPEQDLLINAPLPPLGDHRGPFRGEHLQP